MIEIFISTQKESYSCFMEGFNRSPNWPGFKMETVPWEGNIEVETRKGMGLAREGRKSDTVSERESTWCWKGKETFR